MWELPVEDHNYSKRVGRMKASFTKAFRSTTVAGNARPTLASSRRREADIWQPRFWEHLIRDPEDFSQHLDYIHYNPVKHGVAACPHAHAAFSFMHWVRRGVYSADWQCVCDLLPTPPVFERLRGLSME
jgi:putative transposase